VREKCEFATVLAALIMATSAGICNAQPEQLVVFADKSLIGAFSEIGQICLDHNAGFVLHPSFDGIQALRSRIELNEYADIFVSDDKTQMDLLVAGGYLTSYHKLSRTDLSLIVPDENPNNIQSLADLLNPANSGMTIAMGAETAPVGAYNRQMLTKLRNDSPDALNTAVRDESDTHDYSIVSKVASGAADAGFSYTADVTKELSSQITKIEIPDKYNVDVDYYIGILSGSNHHDLERPFFNIVENVEGKGVQILEDYGFEPIYEPE
jgi:molybdate transport system substrate-binding protein